MSIQMISVRKRLRVDHNLRRECSEWHGKTYVPRVITSHEGNIGFYIPST